MHRPWMKVSKIQIEGGEMYLLPTRLGELTGVQLAHVTKTDDSNLLRFLPLRDLLWSSYNHCDLSFISRVLIIRKSRG